MRYAAMVLPPAKRDEPGAAMDTGRAAPRVVSGTGRGLLLVDHEPAAHRVEHPPRQAPIRRCETPGPPGRCCESPSAATTERCPSPSGNRRLRPPAGRSSWVSAIVAGRDLRARAAVGSTVSGCECPRGRARRHPVCRALRPVAPRRTVQLDPQTRTRRPAVPLRPPSRRRNRPAARIGPTVCELDGPMPIENRSNTETAMTLQLSRAHGLGVTSTLGGSGERSGLRLGLSGAQSRTPPLPRRAPRPRHRSRAAAGGRGGSDGPSQCLRGSATASCAAAISAHGALRLGEIALELARPSTPAVADPVAATDWARHPSAPRVTSTGPAAEYSGPGSAAASGSPGFESG